MAEARQHIDEKTIFNQIQEETGELIRELPFIPDESGGMVLLKDQVANEWNIVDLPTIINQAKNAIYDWFGNQHVFYPLSEIDVATIVQDKVLKERIYTKNISFNNVNQKAKSKG